MASNVVQISPNCVVEWLDGNDVTTAGAKVLTDVVRGEIKYKLWLA